MARIESYRISGPSADDFVCGNQASVKNSITKKVITALGGASRTFRRNDVRERTTQLEGGSQRIGVEKEFHEGNAQQRSTERVK